MSAPRDYVPATSHAAAAAEIAALREALRWIAESGRQYTSGDGHADCIAHANAALGTAPSEAAAAPAPVAPPSDGATLRDQFAMAALTGLLASGQWHNAGAGFAEHIAMQAAEIGDAMLAERAKEATP